MDGKGNLGRSELAAWVENALLDDLVSSQQNGLRDGQPKSLRGLQIEDQLELGRMLNGQFTRLGPF